MMTISELLAQGQSILREKRAADREAAEESERGRRASWEMLLAAVRIDLGEMSASLPVDPPDKFIWSTSQWVVRVRPFGMAWIECRYELCDWDAPSRWKMCRKHNPHSADHARYCIPMQYQGGVEGIDPVGTNASAEHTDDLAEAVALCHEAGASYTAALNAPIVPL